MNKILSSLAITLMLAGAASTTPASADKAPPKNAKASAGKKATKKLTVVSVCPMMQHAVEGDSGGSSVVGNYKVKFCCSGCKPTFDKLSAAEKNKKIQEALTKQKAAKKA
jgi:hypothetical protein